MGCTAVKTQQDVKHCEFSPNWLSKGQEFFLTAEEENFLAITHECEGEQQRFRCLGSRTKLLIFHGGFSACSGRPEQTAAASSHLELWAPDCMAMVAVAGVPPRHGEQEAASSCIGRHGRALLPWWCPGTARAACVWGQGARRGLARGRRGRGRACREPVGGFLILKGVLTSLSAPHCPHVAFPTD